MTQGSDVLADMIRIAQSLRAIRQPLRIATGSPEAWEKLIEDAHIPMTKSDEPYGGSVGRMMGIPITIDPGLPKNMIRIGGRLMMRQESGDWFMVDIDAAMQAVLDERLSPPSVEHEE